MKILYTFLSGPHFLAIFFAKMAEAEADSINKTNLIINYLPQVLSDEEFYSLFSTIGPVYSARIIRERSSGYSYGYGFVKYQKQEHAAKAIDELNGLQILNKSIKVAYSLPAGQDNKNINVYVKGLAATTTNDSLRGLFEPYGHIIECRAIPDRITGLCQGIGFVLFSKKEEAEKAIEALNGSNSHGGSEPLIVKYARKDNKKPTQTADQYFPSWTNNVTRVPTSIRTPMAASPLMQGGGPIRGMASGRGRNINRFSPMNGPRFGFNSGSGQPRFGLHSGGGQPRFNQNSGLGHPHPGFIVFIYGIGPHANEDTLWNMCYQFGDVKRVNVIRDHNKNQGKGYGFVTFTTLQEATYCINQLDGSMYDGKILQVSLKTPKM